MKHVRHIALLAVLAVMASCAQQVAPKGGPKDETAPQIKSSTPQNYSTLFLDNSIELVFDEFVELKSINDALVISPPLAEEPDIKLRGKKLTLTFNETLQPNTTYILNFGNGIVDITENNPLDSNLFVFSTGSKLDSLQVTGSVKMAEDLSPPETSWVMLFEAKADSMLLAGRPAYLAKTNTSGQFKLEFLRSGSFQVAALTDANDNYLYDLPDETIAFLDTVIQSDSTPGLSLAMFQEVRAEQFVSKSQVVGFGQLLVVFGKPATKPRLVDISGKMPSDWYVPEVSQKRDTLMAWVPNQTNGDTLELQVWDGEVVVDTVDVILLKPGEKPRVGRKVQPEEFGLKIVPTLPQNKQNPFKPLRLKANYPIETLDSTKIRLWYDSVDVPIGVKLADSLNHNIQVQTLWKQGKTYRFEAMPGAFVDLFGNANDSIRLEFEAQTKEEFGNFKVDVQVGSQSPAYVVQLISGDKVVRIDRIAEPTTLEYKALAPGAYKLKLIFDDNANGEWDTGNYSERRQPERILFYSGAIDVRPNWDFDLEWKLEGKGESTGDRKKE